MKPLNRRTLLRSASGLAIALPFLEAMRPVKARAEESSVRRIIFEFKPNGDEVDRRFDAVVDEDNFELGEFLQPLDSYRDDALFLHRVNKNFDRMALEERADNHQQGGSSLAPWMFGDGEFSAGNGRSVGYVLGPSADYMIGQRVISAHPSVPYRHLVYRVGDEENDIFNLHSHAGPEGQKNPVIPEVDPFRAYARLFGFFNQTEPEEELLHNLEMKRSVLDLVGGQVTDLQKKLGREDRQRLEIHTEALRDLERTLGPGVASPQCAALDLNAEFDPLADAEHLRSAEVFFKITALSFACDLTRVVNFNWSGNTNDRIYSNLGVSLGHHDLSHISEGLAFAQIRSIHRHLWEGTTKLYEELLNMPDGDGSLWDSTLVFHWNELGQGDSHSVDDSLVVLCGGACGHFKKGKLYDYEKGGSFSDLLTSCFHYMGFDDVMAFGDQRLVQQVGGDTRVLA